jgi:hypothetical protein
MSYLFGFTREQRIAAIQDGNYALDVDQPTAQNMRLCLPLGVHGGTTEYDYSPYGNDATHVTPIARTVAKHPQFGAINVLDFDNVDDYLTVAADTSLDFSTPFTVTARYKPDSFPAGVNSDWGDGILSKGANDTLAGFFGLFLLSNDKAQFGIKDGVGGAKGAISAATLTAGTWHYLVGVWDGVNVIIYLDSVATIGAAAPDKPVLSGVLQIGRLGFGIYTYHIDGNLCDVTVRSGAMTPDLIALDDEQPELKYYPLNLRTISYATSGGSNILESISNTLITTDLATQTLDLNRSISNTLIPTQQITQTLPRFATNFHTGKSQIALVTSCPGAIQVPLKTSSPGSVQSNPNTSWSK